VRRSPLAALGSPDLRRLQVSWSVSAAEAWVFFSCSPAGRCG
jgi:hypothetical protein